MTFRALLLMLCLSLSFSVSIYGNDLTTNSAPKTGFIIPIDGEINGGSLAFLKKAVGQTKTSSPNGDPSLIVFSIDTYGGQVDAAISMANFISDLSAKTHTIAYVTDKAWSAGALIALSCDTIIMSPGASIGSAAPVNAQQGEPLDEKYVSALKTKFKAIAEQNGHNPDIAVAMVDKDYVVKHPDFPDGYLIKEGKLLNMTATESKTAGLAEALTEDLPAYLAESFGQTPTLTTISPTLIDTFVKLITNTAISSILLSLGLLLLVTEFKVPGVGFAGLLGIAALGLALGGQYILEYAEFFEIGIGIVGIVFVFLEIFILPGFGIFGFAGFLFLIVSLFLSFSPSEFLTYPWTRDAMYVGGSMVFGSSLVAIACSLFFIEHIQKIPWFGKLQLNKNLSETPKPKVSSKFEPGTPGIATSDLRPIGTGNIDGHIIDCRAESGYIPKGSPIEIVSFSEMEYIVRPKQTKAQNT